uniref:Sodium-coupled monocarboxylate transporter 1 n=1 Tax=Callorhinchus milii TaxID=7868 RepID=A0A4W3JZV3_CALMI
MFENKVLQAWDYVVFGVMLAVSAAIGVFYAAKNGKGTTEEFLVGNRKISAYPIALSLASSFLSAITVIGVPTEIYTYGIMIVLHNICSLFTMVVTSLIYIPLFYRLNLISTYEYLNRRFGNFVRYQAVGCFLLYMVITGLNLWISIITTGLVCALYTTLGGIKAVVWTDVVQICVMMAGLVALFIQGTIHVGGFGKVWSIAESGGRLNFFDFDPDPRRRLTFWTILIGGTFSWVTIYGCNQAQVQRYLACKSEKEAIKAVLLNWLGSIIVTIPACLCGLVMYAVYETCDPLMTKRISNPNQMTPLLVMDILSQTPGIPGLFVACAFSGTLSTVSSGINAMAAVVVEDIFKAKWKPWNYISNDKKTLISKFLAMTFGLATIGLAGVASTLQGNIMQASQTVLGLIQGPTLGVFTLAALFPRSNSKGALVGMFVGLALSLWLGIGAQIYPPVTRFARQLNISSIGCLQPNATISTPVNGSSLVTTTIASEAQEGISSIMKNFYSLSFMYYCLIGCLCTILVGLMVSFCTGGAKDVDPTLIAPIIKNFSMALLREEQTPPLPESNENTLLNLVDNHFELLEPVRLKHKISL